MCDHLKSVNESYFKHFTMAMKYAMRFLGGFLACLIHAIFPCIFVDTGSTIAREIAKDVDRRHDQGKEM